MSVKYISGISLKNNSRLARNFSIKELFLKISKYSQEKHRLSLKRGFGGCDGLGGLGGFSGLGEFGGFDRLGGFDGFGGFGGFGGFAF